MTRSLITTTFQSLIRQWHAWLNCRIGFRVGIDEIFGRQVSGGRGVVCHTNGACRWRKSHDRVYALLF